MLTPLPHTHIHLLRSILLTCQFSNEKLRRRQLKLHRVHGMELAFKSQQSGFRLHIENRISRWAMLPLAGKTVCWSQAGATSFGLHLWPMEQVGKKIQLQVHALYWWCPGTLFVFSWGKCEVNQKEGNMGRGNKETVWWEEKQEKKKKRQEMMQSEENESLAPCEHLRGRGGHVLRAALGSSHQLSHLKQRETALLLH